MNWDVHDKWTDWIGDFVLYGVIVWTICAAFYVWLAII